MIALSPMPKVSWYGQVWLWVALFRLNLVFAKSIVLKSPTYMPTPLPVTNSSEFDPNLAQFDLNMNYGNITLSFDKPVNASTFDISKLHIILRRDAINSSTYQIFENISISYTSYHQDYTVTYLGDVYNNIASQGNSTYSLNIYLTSDDYARITYNIYNSTYHINETLVHVSRGLVRSYDGYSNNSTYTPVSSVVLDKSKPYLVSYSLDMNAGNLQVNFSEPMNVSSLTLDGLVLQSHQNSLIEGAYLHLINNSSHIIKSSNLDRSITVSLGAVNLNSVKARIGLAVSLETSFLSSINSFAADLSGNLVSIVAFDRSYGMAAKSYIPDTTSPSFLSWALDLDVGRIVIEFSETVYIDYFNYSAYHITSSESYNESTDALMSFRRPISIQSTSSSVVSITIDEDELDILKSSEKLCRTGLDDCYLVLDEDLVCDTSLAQNFYNGSDASIASPRLVSSFHPDTVRPYLISYRLNLSSRAVQLVFSEYVKVSSIRLDQLQLQESQAMNSRIETLALSDLDNVTTSIPSRNVSIYLNRLSFEALRSSTRLGKRKGSVYLSISRYFITDYAMSPNYVRSISKGQAMAVANFIPDYNAPALISWTIDLNSYLINVTFSQPIDPSKISFKSMKLSSSNQSSSLDGETVILEIYGYRALMHNTLIMMQLSSSDKNNIQSSETICLDYSSCYLSIDDSFGYGFTSYDDDQPIQIPVATAEYVPVYDLVKDATGPSISNVTLDMTEKALTIQFNEVITYNSFDVSTIYLSHDINRTTQVQLSDPLSFIRLNQTYGYSSDIIIHLSLYDTIQIKSYLFNYSSIDYLIMDSSMAIYDLRGNPLQSKNRSHLISSMTYLADTTHPILLAASYNDSGSILDIYFDDLVNISMINSSSIVLVLSTTSGNSIRIPLIDATLSETMNKIQISSELSLNISNSLYSSLQTKSIYQSYPGASISVYISSQSIHSAISAASNAIMTQSNAIQTGNLINSFRLDMTDAFIALEMVIPIDDIQSITSKYFTLASSLTAVSYTLTGFQSCIIISNRLIFLYFNAADYDKVQLHFSSIYFSSNMMLKLTNAKAIIDSKGLTLSSVKRLYCNSYRRDTTTPYVKSFSLNLNKQIISLSFNKYILGDSFDASRLALINTKDMDSYSSYISLSDAAVSYSSSYLNYTKTITLSLSSKGPLSYNESSIYDRSSSISLTNLIQLTNSIGKSISTTYLLLRDDYVEDLSYPANRGLGNTTGLIVTTLILDKTVPSLLYFDMNMNQRSLTMYYSKFMRLQSNRVNYYYLVSDRSSKPQYSYRLSKNSTTYIPSNNISYAADSIVTIILSVYDIDQIISYAPNLCYSASNCYLAMRKNAINDISYSSNFVTQILSAFAYQASTFTPDTTSPKLSYFDINMNEGFIDFVFNEPMRCRTINPSRIILQAADFVGILSRYSYALSSSVYTLCNNQLSIHQYMDIDSYVHSYIDSYVYIDTDQYSRKIRLILSYQDLLSIKSSQHIATAASTTFLRFTLSTISYQEDAIISSDDSSKTSAFSDVYGNGIDDIIDGYAISVRNYTIDSSPPRLLSFMISSYGQLTMDFDKPMNISSLEKAIKDNQIHFQNAQSNPTKVYALNFLTAKSYDYYMKSIVIDMNTDFDMLTTFIPRIESIQSIIYLSVYSSDDGNISSTSDVYGNHLKSSSSSGALPIGPSIFTWDINMNHGNIDLYFTNPVDDNYMNKIGYITIQNGPSDISSNVSYTLMHSLRRIDIVETTIPSVAYIHRLTLSPLDHSTLQVYFPNRYSNLYLSVKSSLTRAKAKDTIIPQLKSIEIASDSALYRNLYIPDTSLPRLEYFNINLDDGMIELYFNKPIVLPTINRQGIIFITSLGITIPLSDNTVISYSEYNATIYSNRTVIDLKLSTDQLNDVKYHLTLSNIDTCLMTASTITDFSGNKNTAHKASLGTIQNDTTAPILLNFIVNMETYQLIFQFDEYLDLSILSPYNFYFIKIFDNASDILSSNDLSTGIYIDVSGIRTNISYYPLFSVSPYSYVYRNASDSIILDLLNYQMDIFKLETISRDYEIDIFSNVNNSFIMATSNSLSDFFGNSISSRNIIFQANVFIPNQSLVELLSFTYISSMRIIRMYFSKIINVNAFNCSDFMFQNSSTLSGKSFDLSSHDCHTLTIKNSSAVSFVVDDMAITSMESSIFSSEATTYLSMRNDSLSMRDIYGYEIKRIEATNALRMGSQLLHWLLDINSLELLLIYSAPMNASYYMNGSCIGFVSSTTSESIQLSENMISLKPLVYPYVSSFFPYEITNSSLPLRNSSMVSMKLSDRDIARLKIFGIDQSNRYLLVNDGCFKDIYEQHAMPTTIKDKLSAMIIVADSVSPLIVNSTLDLGAETLSIHFNEPIDEGSFIVTLFTLQADPTIIDIGNRTNLYSLTGGSITYSIASDYLTSTIVIALTSIDAAYLKLSPTIAKNLSNVFISWTYHAVNDLYGNYLVPVDFTVAQQVTSVIEDSTSPELLYFDLNMNEGVLTLYFNEPIDIISIYPSNITIQSRFSQGAGAYYTLTGGSIILSYLSEYASYNLTTIFVSIKLSPTDLDGIKVTAGLARTKASSYLSVSYGIAKDLNGNYMTPIYASNGMACRKFTSDTTRPDIVNVTLDFESQTLTCLMSEPVILSDINSKYLTVMFPDNISPSMDITSNTYVDTQTVTYSYVISESLASIASISFDDIYPGVSSTISTTLLRSLTLSSSYVDSSNIISSSVVIYLSSNNMNKIKSMYPVPLGDSMQYIHLNYSSKLVHDTFSNYLHVQIFGKSIDKIIPDTTRPTLVSYHFDMTKGAMIFTFSEAIQVLAFNFSQLFIQNTTNRYTRYSSSVSLSDYTIISINSPENNIIGMNLTGDVLLYMKFYGIGKTLKTTYISWNECFVKDYSGNCLEPRYDASVYKYSPMVPSVHITDKDSPILTRWYLSESDMILVLRFDEPVQISSLETIFIGGYHLENTFPKSSSTYSDIFYIQLPESSSSSVCSEISDVSINSLCAVNIETTFSSENIREVVVDAQGFVYSFNMIANYTLSVVSGSIYDFSDTPSYIASVIDMEPGQPGKWIRLCHTHLVTLLYKKTNIILMFSL